MRIRLAFVMAVLLSLAAARLSTAQAFQFRSPVPEVTAATASWQVASEPILVQGLVYLATRDYRLFDGQVMAQVGIYQGVPVYADTTLEPYSVAYVPVGAQRMRSYERVRERELAGTTGSRTPSFPVRSPAVPAAEEQAVGTAGTVVPSAVGPTANAPVPKAAPPSRTTVESIPRPGATNGIWLYFKGNRYYLAGAAVPFSGDRFALIGQHEGFPVYRDKNGNQNQIWIAVVNGGPLAPYVKR
jgi:hypothetical protein